MYSKFCETMKTLRKQRGLNQEQMAETLGVSAQAVSKWETGGSFPDISLLPIIADYFGVSVDYLLGHDTSKRVEKIEKICLQAEALFQEQKYMQAVSLLREALIQHPGNEKLMYSLAWALSGTLCESPDNYDEAILLYHKILEISTDTAMRTKVTRDLMYRYYTKEEYDKALACAHALPPFAVCREYNLGRGNLYAGKQLAEYLQSNIHLFGAAMMECLEYFVDDRILTAEEKQPYTVDSAKEKMELLKQIMA